MGTKNTMQQKMGIVTSIIRKCADKKIDIDKEALIASVMLELFCERRKAREIIKAVITQFNYEESKEGFVFTGN